MQLPAQKFFLFGIADRRKLLYRGGRLTDLRSGEVVWSANVAEGSESIDATRTQVTVETDRGVVVLREDAAGVWVGGERVASGRPVNLPTFAEHKHGPRLRALHHEILVNMVDGRPLPNLLAYDRPWYRDAAMVGMVLEKTNNLELIRDWVRGLREPFDRNNIPPGGTAEQAETEADNLGQVLYLLSLADNASHPLVPKVLEAARRFERSGALFGRTDFADHPVYITKWMKFGLASLGLEDPYVIPRVPDSYSALVWWAYRSEHVPTARLSKETGERYPYLAWAEAHFYRTRVPPLPRAEAFPQTWQAEASAANYARMAAVSSEYEMRKIAAPHAWHAAEVFLYLMDVG
ncbi:MAG: hypothetical protein ACK4PI_02500 [Tepidisphaerales bacterium]